MGPEKFEPSTNGIREARRVGFSASKLKIFNVFFSALSFPFAHRTQTSASSSLLYLKNPPFHSVTFDHQPRWHSELKGPDVELTCEQTMTWIEKELKRRARDLQLTVPHHSVITSDSARIQELWNKFKDANTALPREIQLQIDNDSSFPASGDDAMIVEWLRAPNGASLGFSGNAIRYICHIKTQRKSNNFWIRWDAQQQGFVLNQRKSASIPPSVAQYRFDQDRAQYMMKCLVLGKRISSRSVRKKHLWFF